MMDVHQEGSELPLTLHMPATKKELTFDAMKRISDWFALTFHHFFVTVYTYNFVFMLTGYFEYLSENSLNFPAPRDDLVIRADANAGAFLVDGLRDGILLEAADQDSNELKNITYVFC